MSFVFRITSQGDATHLVIGLRAFIVDWSFSGIMTSKLVICESELPLPAAWSILISGMTSSLAIIPYLFLIAVLLINYYFVFQLPHQIDKQPEGHVSFLKKRYLAHYVKLSNSLFAYHLGVRKTSWYSCSICHRFSLYK